MKRNVVLPFLALLLTFQASVAQTKTVAKPKPSSPAKSAAAVTPAPAPAEDPVLMQIGTENVPRSEFERVFRKNNRDSVFTEKSIRDYLDLYINYKLKVKEAESMKMDTSDAFRTELGGYRKQLAQPYLTDKDVAEGLVQEAYDRLKKEVRASHVLIKLSAEALPKDTLAAYNRILKIREQIIKGGDFAKIAKDSSDDPSAKENGGDLGYFTGMQMVYPFESVAYNTKPGQVSMPVRTRFGYHIIKVTDSRPAQGEIHVAHIMVRLPKDASDSTKKAAHARIVEAQNALKNGIAWDSVATKYSDDKASAKRAGELPWFGTGRMVPEFEKTAFSLKNNGDISDIIQTTYGYHIIKRLESRGIPTFDEKKGELRQMILRDSRSEASKASMINHIKSDYNYKDYPKNKDEIVMAFDSSLVNGEWDLNKADKYSKPLFSLTDSGMVHTYTQQDFAKYVSTHQTKRGGTTAQSIGYSMYKEWINDECLAFEELRLDKKYPEFRNLMKEYRDGILLFDLTDKMVWSKAVKDSTGLQAYYEKNKSNYMWGERADAVIYTCKDAKTADNFRKQMQKGKKSAVDIMNDLNKEVPNSVTMREGRFNRGENEIVEHTGWKTGLSQNIEFNKEVDVVDVKKVIPAEPKTLDEARGLITADYQTYLEKEWISELRKKYPVHVNESVLQTTWQH